MGKQDADRITELVTSRVTSRVTKWGVFIALAGLGLLFLTNLTGIKNYPSIEEVIDQVGGTLITAGGLGVLWDLRGRRDFADEILAKTKLSTDVHETGLQSASIVWRSIPWEELIGRARHIEVFLAYSDRWSRHYERELKAFIGKSGNSLRFYITDPNDKDTIEVLAKRYEKPISYIQQKIRETTQFLSKLGEGAEAEVGVYHRDGDPTFACYRFDDEFVVTLYSHRRAAGGDVFPVMRFHRGGSFGDFFSDEMQYILDQSTKYEPVKPSVEASEN